MTRCEKKTEVILWHLRLLMSLSFPTSGSLTMCFLFVMNLLWINSAINLAPTNGCSHFWIRVKINWFVIWKIIAKIGDHETVSLEVSFCKYEKSKFNVFLNVFYVIQCFNYGFSARIPQTRVFKKNFLILISNELNDKVDHFVEDNQVFRIV